MLHVVSGILIALLAVSWLAAWTLTRHSRRNPTIRSMHERSIAAIALAIGVTGMNLVYYDLLVTDVMPNDADIFIGIVARLIITLPSAYWLFLYYTNGFRDDDDPSAE